MLHDSEFEDLIHKAVNANANVDVSINTNSIINTKHVTHPQRHSVGSP